MEALKEIERDGCSTYAGIAVFKNTKAAIEIQAEVGADCSK